MAAGAARSSCQQVRAAGMCPRCYQQWLPNRQKYLWHGHSWAWLYWDALLETLSCLKRGSSGYHAWFPLSHQLLAIVSKLHIGKWSSRPFWNRAGFSREIMRWWQPGQGIPKAWKSSAQSFRAKDQNLLHQNIEQDIPWVCFAPQHTKGTSGVSPCGEVPSAPKQGFHLLKTQVVSRYQI